MSRNAHTSDEEVSRAFVSLAEFLKEENLLDKESTKDALRFLDALEPSDQEQSDAERVLLKLVPSPENDTKPFADHALNILGSPTATDLVDPLLYLISQALWAPLRPFFVFICGSYLTLEEEEENDSTSWISEMVEADDTVSRFLMNIRGNLTDQRTNDRDTLIRTKRVLRELTEEGLDDVVSVRLHWIPEIYMPGTNREFSKGIIINRGGNLFGPDETLDPRVQFVTQFLDL
ncbi:hypothetical protein BLNAU_21348 [Blattamonas nauphoetae]|uniref:Uncharacterized protein n=1 Tax=Blattamonas nauphoetae TaxID=2049346 RepID=A0ABQ9WW59_9EUKA|nr:hypothetical protein BLNAU_21348 [Blattamonas nauphoetae]